MPVITKIVEQKRRPNRRNIYLDGRFAFGCNVNVVARFLLREGMTITSEQLQQIERGEVKQECLDKALQYLQRRLHSRSELQRKLARAEFGSAVIEAVLDDLTRLGYIDDARFAQTKALAAVQHKHHGQRRAMLELLKSGVKSEVARRALSDVYTAADSTAVARELAIKQAPRLRRLEPPVARRRLVAMLQRRGFDYDTIKPIVDEVLGNVDDDA